jgi:hypothetical protein
MDDVSVDGAIAAATYFLSLFPYAHESGDLTQWKAMSHPECIFCASVATGVEEMHAKGHHQEGSGLRIETSVGTEINPGVFFQVDVTGDQEAWRELDSTGALVTEGPALDRLVMHLAVVRDGTTWFVREVEIDETAG